MGWFTSSAPTPAPGTPANPEPSQDGGYIAPDRSARSVCWEKRDEFFACLDRNNILNSIKDDVAVKKVCPKELVEFEKSCASSWVTYFKQKRVADYQKEMKLRELEAKNAKQVDLGGMSGGSGMTAAALRGK